MKSCNLQETLPDYRLRSGSCDSGATAAEPGDKGRRRAERAIRNRLNRPSESLIRLKSMPRSSPAVVRDGTNTKKRHAAAERPSRHGRSFHFNSDCAGCPQTAFVGGRNGYAVDRKRHRQ